MVTGSEVALVAPVASKLSRDSPALALESVVKLGVVFT